MKKVALPLAFLVVFGVAACSSDKKPETPQETASSVVSSMNTSGTQNMDAMQKTAMCKSAAMVEKTIGISSSMGQDLSGALKTVADPIMQGLNKLPQDIQDNIKPYIQDAVDGKTSGPQYDGDLAKAKTFCGDEWKSPVPNVGK